MSGERDVSEAPKLPRLLEILIYDRGGGVIVFYEYQRHSSVFIHLFIGLIFFYLFFFRNNENPYQNVQLADFVPKSAVCFWNPSQTALGSQACR